MDLNDAKEETISMAEFMGHKLFPFAINGSDRRALLLMATCQRCGLRCYLIWSVEKGLIGDKQFLSTQCGTVVVLPDIVWPYSLFQRQPAA